MKRRKAIFYSLVITLLSPLIIFLLVFLGYQVVQFFSIRYRQPVAILMEVQSTNGTALSGVKLRFREKGSRFGLPLPFSPGWETKGKVHEIMSNESGQGYVSFREHKLYLEEISRDGETKKDFITIHHIYGRHLTNRYHAPLYYRFDSLTNHEKLTIVLQ